MGERAAFCAALRRCQARRGISLGLAGPPKESGGRTEARTREKKNWRLLLLFSSVFSIFFIFSRASAPRDLSEKAENARPKSRHQQRAHAAPLEGARKSDKRGQVKSIRIGCAHCLFDSFKFPLPSGSFVVFLFASGAQLDATGSFR